MLIDIIIPFYNAQGTITRALNSIAMQSLDDGDKIMTTIVNDCSTEVDPDDMDSLGEYFKELIDLQIINRPQNGGPGATRQTGLDHTHGDYVMFMDADDCLISPFAVRTLKRAIVSNKSDFGMGIFFEETPSGDRAVHEQNFTWLHGKMFKRAFLDKHKLRFNDTRQNEDVGFLLVLAAFTDKVTYLPHAVYCWMNQEGSLVRRDNSGYAFGYGFRGFVENLAWVVEECARKHAKKSKICEYAAQFLCQLYWYEMESNEKAPKEAEANEAKIREYYERAVRPYVRKGLIDKAFIIKAYKDILKNYTIPDVIPVRDFNQYLTDLGFNDDIKKGDD